MYFVYILKCADNSLYTGITNDLKKRIDSHNNSKTGARYTKSRRPVALVYFEKKRNKSFALKREFQIKKMKREEKLKLWLDIVPGNKTTSPAKLKTKSTRGTVNV